MQLAAIHKGNDTMKKLLLSLVLSLLVLGIITTIALADNGPHGGFNGSTEACASCHRAHSAVSTDGFLLVADDVYSLCTSCHDGTGAYTNVVDGYYDTRVGDPAKPPSQAAGVMPNVGLFGGGFVNARMLTDYGNASNEGGLANPTTNTGANQNSLSPRGRASTPMTPAPRHPPAAGLPLLIRYMAPLRLSGDRATTPAFPGPPMALRRRSRSSAPPAMTRTATRAARGA